MDAAPRPGPLAIIAGAGRLPAEIAAEVVARGESVVVLPLQGIADADFGALTGETVGLLDPAGAIAALGRAGASGVVLAGTVHKPSLGLVLAGWRAVRRSDEIRRIVEAAHQTAKDLLNERRAELDRISKILLERETIDAEQFVDALLGDTA